MRIAIDAMGGDHAPAAVVEGAVHAARTLSGDSLLLVGRTDEIRAALRGARLPDNIELIHCDDVIAMDAAPSAAMRKQRHASMPVAINLVKEGGADVVLSAGNTGCLVGFSHLQLKTLPGVQRPGISVLLPTLKAPCVLIDAGANIIPKPEHLVQYAIMGSLYSKGILGIQKPSVSLLNIGTEPEKGTQFIKDTDALLRKCEAVHYAGYIEGNRIFAGETDVVICEGFLGNAVLKVAEGLCETLMGFMKSALNSSLKAKVGAMLSRQALKSVKVKIDMSEYGGAPLLGVNGVVIKCHGRADSKAVYNGIKVAARFVELKINEQITAALGDSTAHENPLAKKTA